MAGMILYTSKTEAAAKKAFQAALAGDFDAVKKLIDHSFNTEDCDPEGNSLLHYAVRGANPQIVRYLVDACGMSPVWANTHMVTPYDERSFPGKMQRHVRSGNISAVYAALDRRSATGIPCAGECMQIQASSVWERITIW